MKYPRPSVSVRIRQLPEMEDTLKREGYRGAAALVHVENFILYKPVAALSFANFWKLRKIEALAGKPGGLRESYYFGELRDQKTNQSRSLYLVDFRGDFGRFGTNEQFRTGRWLKEMLERRRMIAGNARQVETGIPEE